MFVAEFDLQRRHPCVDAPLPNHAAMIQACKDGDLSMLKEGLQNLPLDTPSWNCSIETRLNSPPCSEGVLIAAIENGQVEIVKYWLSRRPRSDCIYHLDVLCAITKNFNLEIAELFNQHCSGWKNNCPYFMESFLATVCCQGPQTLPMVQFLVDKGADVRYGTLLEGRAGAVSPALRTGFPIEIIEKMIDHGAWLETFPLFREIEKENIEALKLFVVKRRIVPTNSEEDQQILEKAHKTGNKELIALMEKYVRQKNRKNAKKANAGGWIPQTLSKLSGLWPARAQKPDAKEEKKAKVSQNEKESPRSSFTEESDFESLEKPKS